MALALEKLTENVEVIQTLGVYPNQENGLSGLELQQMFDAGNRIIKDFINEKVVPAFNQLAENQYEIAAATTKQMVNDAIKNGDIAVGLEYDEETESLNIIVGGVK